MMRIEIAQGRVIDPRNQLDQVTPVYLADGKVLAIGQAPAGFVPDRVIDARGRLVCPGLVDLAVRLPSLQSELKAAVAAGVTTLVCPPDTRPPLDEPGLVERLIGSAQSFGLARVRPLGALIRGADCLSEMATLHQAGCIGFSTAGRHLPDNRTLLRALQYAATFGFTVWLQPEDAALACDGVAHEGAVASRLGLPSIPACSETIAVASLIELARATGAKLHLTRLSTAEGAALVGAARAAGLQISADVAAHQLHLTEHDIGFFKTSARLHPPLRTEADRQGLAAALVRGEVQAICSDHTPVGADGKLLPFGEAEPGAAGVEVLLPLTLAWAASHSVPLAVALARLTTGPAAIAGLDCGHLTPGAVADLCLIDPDAAWQVGGDDWLSRGKNTPFQDQWVKGRVDLTLVGGQVAFERRV